MAKTKSVDILGQAFCAATAAEAKAIGTAAMTTFVEESRRGPSAYRVGAMTVLVWAEIEGWSYRCIQSDDKPGLVQSMCYSGGTRESVSISAVGHAASWQWTADVTDDLAYFTQAFSCIGSPWDATRAIRDAVSQAGWYRRAKVAQDMGATDAHGIACKTETIEQAVILARASLPLAA